MIYMKVMGRTHNEVRIDSLRAEVHLWVFGENFWRQSRQWAEKESLFLAGWRLCRQNNFPQVRLSEPAHMPRIERLCVCFGESSPNNFLYRQTNTFFLRGVSVVY